MVRYMLFDFDGTLADSKGLAYELLQGMADRHGFRRMKPGEWEELNRLPLKLRLKKFGVPLLKLPAYALELRKRYAERLHAVPVFPEMVPVVRALGERYSLGVLSSNDPGSIRAVLAGAGLHHFQTIDASFNLFGKDAKLKSFLRKHKLSPADLIYVGDELRDIEACREAGVRCAAVTWGFDSRALLAKAKPDWLIDRPVQLLRLG